MHHHGGVHPEAAAAVASRRRRRQLQRGLYVTVGGLQQVGLQRWAARLGPQGVCTPRRQPAGARRCRCFAWRAARQLRRLLLIATVAAAAARLPIEGQPLNRNLFLDAAPSGGRGVGQHSSILAPQERGSGFRLIGQPRAKRGQLQADTGASLGVLGEVWEGGRKVLCTCYTQLTGSGLTARQLAASCPHRDRDACLRMLCGANGQQQGVLAALTTLSRAQHPPQTPQSRC